MDKKKVVIAVILLLAVIAVILAIVLNNKNSVLTVSYEVDGKIVKTENIEKGNTATKPTNPTKEGYDFLGWYLGAEKFDFSTAIEENIKLEAKWVSKVDENNKTYTITLNIDGEEEKVKTDASGILDNVKNPTKEGYKFLGWYVGDEKVDLSKPFEKDTTIVAKWEKDKKETSNTSTKPTEPEKPTTPTVKKYTVTFNSNGGSSVAKQTVESGKTATKPGNPTKDGYTFKGWYLNNTQYNFSSKVTKNITLTAKWEKNQVVEEQVISYYKQEIDNSSVGQVRIFVTLNGEEVAGTIDITSISGKKITKDVPATGLVFNGKIIQSLSNPKVK